MLKSLAYAKRQARLVAIALAATGMVVGHLASVSAALLTDVSVELSDPRPGQTSVTYTFAASGFTASTARCITIALNDQADGGGSIPTGISTTSAALSGSSSAIPTPGSWSTDFTSNGTLKATLASGETLVTGNMILTGITNGSVEGTTYYALINTYSDVSCSTPLDNQVAAFIYTDGEPVSLLIQPTLSFSISGVTSGQPVFPVGGPVLNTTVLSDASGIDHGVAVTTSQNGISAHDLNVSTNASAGYNVYIRHTQLLTNEQGDTIANHTGNNASPSSFPVAGNEAWGYSTDDADLAQFHGLNLWAGFPTSGGSGGDRVMTKAGATPGSESARVGHQVGVAIDTPAGTYTTTIVYTVVATF